jgi:hypothetical protein
LCTNEAEQFLRSLNEGDASADVRNDAGVETNAELVDDAAAAAPPSPAPEVDAGIAAQATRPRDLEQPALKVNPCPQARKAPEWPVAFSFFSPLGLPWSPPKTSVFFGALYGNYVSTHGVALGTVLRADCETEGLLLTAMTLAEGPVDGVSLAGALAVHRAKVRGFTLAPLAILGDLDGASVSFVNVRTGTLRGAEIGLANFDPGVTHGFVLGLVNLGTANMRGVQAGLLNIATSELEGAQVGLINVGGIVHGTQVGLINVAKDSAASFGLQSVSWSRKVRGYAWTSTATPIQIGIQWEGRTVFAGLNFGRLVQGLIARGDLALGAQLGIHLTRPEESGVLLDVLAGVDGTATGTNGRVVDIVRAGARLGYRFQPRFAPYVYGGVVSEAQYRLIDGFDTADLTIAVNPEFGAGLLF